VTPNCPDALARAGAEFKYRDSYTIVKNSGSVVRVPGSVQVDTAALYSAGKMRSNGGDIGLAYGRQVYAVWIVNELGTGYNALTIKNTESHAYLGARDVSGYRQVRYIMDYGEQFRASGVQR
jgi:hypothetical protein